jgi:hypothetical protein
VRTPADCFEELKKDIDSVRRVEPELARRLLVVVLRLHSITTAARPEPVALAHNALRFSHVFRRAEGFGLIDLDGMSMAGQSADAGSFLAYLTLAATERLGQEDLLEACRRVFQEAVADARATDPVWLTFYGQMAILTWVVRRFHSLDNGWREQAEGILDLGERLLAEAQRG